MEFTIEIFLGGLIGGLSAEFANIYRRVNYKMFMTPFFLSLSAIIVILSGFIPVLLEANSLLVALLLGAGWPMVLRNTVSVSEKLKTGLRERDTEKPEE